MKKGAFWRDLWRALTGDTTHWLRTLVLATLAGRLSRYLGVAVFLVALGPQWMDAPEGGGGFSGMMPDISAEMLFAAVIFAPVVESLVIRLMVWLTGSPRWLGWPVWVTSLIVAVIAVPAHGLSLLSLVVAPLFALMAAIQHHWMLRGRGWAGFWLITAIHALVNGLGFALKILWPAAG